MASISVTEARKRLFALVDEVGESHTPIEIHGKRSNAVLVSEDDWRAIQETLYLTAIPGMRESIVDGMATPIGDLSEDPGWLVGVCCSPAKPSTMPASWRVLRQP